MPMLQLPVRYYRDYAPAYDYAFETLSLPLERTAFLVVDVDGEFYGQHPLTQNNIVPALTAARQANMQVAYVHNDLTLVADAGNIVFEVWGKTKGGGSPEAWRKMAPYTPQYTANVAPLPDEPNFPKWVWSGFHDTFLDQHLRAHDIKTLVCVGYSLRACLYGTLIDAVYRNYRVIVLRDCVEAHEQPDTQDAAMPEGGWINRIMLRQIEHLIGYTSTAQEFVAALQAATSVAVPERENGKVRV
jgi:nicotinamidase-related amidase